MIENNSASYLSVSTNTYSGLDRGSSLFRFTGLAFGRLNAAVVIFSAVNQKQYAETRLFVNRDHAAVGIV